MRNLSALKTGAEKMRDVPEEHRAIILFNRERFILAQRNIYAAS